MGGGVPFDKVSDLVRCEKYFPITPFYFLSDFFFFFLVEKVSCLADNPYRGFYVFKVL